MSIYKVTFFFEGFQAATTGTGSAVGWTESWYKESAAGILAMVEDPGIEQYTKYRLACLAPQFRNSFIRVSKQDGGKDFKLINGDGAGTAAGAANVKAQVQCSILVDLERVPGALETGRTHHRRFLLRGLPADVIDGDVINNTVKDYGLVNEFFQLIGGKPSGGSHAKGIPNWTWGVRWNSILLEHQIAKLITPADFFGRLLAVGPAFGPGGPEVGGQVQIRGVKAPNQAANHIWTYVGPITIGGVAYSALTGVRKPINVNVDGPGVGIYKYIVYATAPVTQYATIGLRTKKTGKPFRQLRGRR